MLLAFQLLLAFQNTKDNLAENFNDSHTTASIFAFVTESKKKEHQFGCTMEELHKLVLQEIKLVMPNDFDNLTN